MYNLINLCFSIQFRDEACFLTLVYHIFSSFYSSDGSCLQRAAFGTWSACLTGWWSQTQVMKLGACLSENGDWRTCLIPYGKAAGRSCREAGLINLEVYLTINFNFTINFTIGFRLRPLLSSGARRWAWFLWCWRFGPKGLQRLQVFLQSLLEAYPNLFWL